MKLADYVAHDGLGLADLVRRREVSVGELDDCARRMGAAVNAGVNALIEVYPEPLAGSDDPAAPFRGVPFAIKDLVLHAAGQRMEMASRLMQGTVFPHDTDLMARFRHAGLRTVGRANSPEFGYCPTTEPLLHGPTRNPWDAALSAGGSSGGSGAAVAAGIVPLAHASDGGGSIRIPAACNGLVGLKPTRGRTPIGPDSAEGLNGLGIEFAVTRSVRDCAALLDAVHGPGVGDPYVAPAPATSYAAAARREPGRLRVALLRTPWNGVAPDREVAQALDATARDCESLGHTVVEAGPALDWEEFLTYTMRYWTANLAAGISQVAGLLGRPVDTTTLEATTLACYRHGAALTATELLQAMDVANRITRGFAAFFQQYDVLLTPTLPTPPAPLGTLDANDAALDAEGWTRKVFAYTPFTPVFNMTGQPAISLPLARTKSGVPIGMQFAARYGAEDTLLGLAAQFEATRPWPQVSPLALAAARG